MDNYLLFHLDKYKSKTENPLQDEDINKKCLHCIENCKQSSKTELLHCPNFKSIVPIYNKKNK